MLSIIPSLLTWPPCLINLTPQSTPHPPINRDLASVISPGVYSWLNLTLLFYKAPGKFPLVSASVRTMLFLGNGFIFTLQTLRVKGTIMLSCFLFPLAARKRLIPSRGLGCRGMYFVWQSHSWLRLPFPYLFYISCIFLLLNLTDLS